MEGYLHKAGHFLSIILWNHLIKWGFQTNMVIKTVPAYDGSPMESVKRKIKHTELACVILRFTLSKMKCPFLGIPHQKNVNYFHSHMKDAAEFKKNQTLNVEGTSDIICRNSRPNSFFNPSRAVAN